MIPLKWAFHNANQIISNCILLIIRVFLPSLLFEVKPQQPVNLTLTKNNKEFNITWEMAYKEDENVELFGELIYRVRLRPKGIMNEVKHYTALLLELTEVCDGTPVYNIAPLVLCCTLHVMDKSTLQIKKKSK